MRLSSAQVSLFRNIVDSGPVEVEGDITCLLGKNESGKTTFLQALASLNPAYEGSFGLDLAADYPRWRKTRDAREMDLSEVVPVRATFELDAEESEDLSTQIGLPLPERVFLRVGRRYDGEMIVELDVDEREAMAALVAGAAQLGLADRAATRPKPQDLAALFKEELSKLPKDKKDEVKLLRDLLTTAEMVAELSTSGLTGKALDSVVERLPRFFYFSEYSALAGRIDLTNLFTKAQRANAKLEDHERTALSLLRLAGVDDGEFLDADFETRISELEAAANELSGEVFRYWSQNRDIRVSLVSDAAPIGTGKTQTIHRFLDLRLHDLRHQVTTNFERRSPGFRWFFSFVAAFSEFERAGNVIILLDEPGRGLHAQAQLDLLRFIDDRVARNNQLLFTTHSNFMIDASRLERVRVVEDMTSHENPEAGSQIFDDLGAANLHTMLPLQAAVGQDLARSVFTGPRSLLVHGPSDLVYLQTFSEYLSAAGRESLDPRWQIMPAGGCERMPTLIALFDRDTQLTVLGSASISGEALNALVTRGLIQRERILPLLRLNADDTGRCLDIEDLFETSEYLALYNTAHGTSLREEDVAGEGPIRARLRRGTGQEPGVDEPATALLRDKARMLERLSAETIDRFASLIRDINAALPRERRRAPARSEPDRSRAAASSSEVHADTQPRPGMADAIRSAGMAATRAAVRSEQSTPEAPATPATRPLGPARPMGVPTAVSPEIVAAAVSQASSTAASPAMQAPSPAPVPTSAPAPTSAVAVAPAATSSPPVMEPALPRPMIEAAVEKAPVADGDNASASPVAEGESAESDGVGDDSVAEPARSAEDGPDAAEVEDASGPRPGD